jgi:putative oxidoreductase
MITARWNDTMTSIGLLILRFGVGGYLAIHGWGKVQMVIDGQFEGFPDPFGIGPAPSLVLAAGAEFACSILVMMGLLTRFAVIPILITMLVAAFHAHANDPWTSDAGAKLFMDGKSKFPLSKEPALINLFAFAALLFTGPGRFSLDALLWPKLKARRGGGAARKTG